MRVRYQPGLKIASGYLFLAVILGLCALILFHTDWPLLIMVVLSQYRILDNIKNRLLYPNVIRKLEMVSHSAKLRDLNYGNSIERYSYSAIFEYYRTDKIWTITVYASGIEHSDNVSDLSRRFGEAFGVVPFVEKKAANYVIYRFPIISRDEVLHENEF